MKGVFSHIVWWAWACCKSNIRCRLNMKHVMMLEVNVIHIYLALWFGIISLQAYTIWQCKKIRTRRFPSQRLSRFCCICVYGFLDTKQAYGTVVLRNKILNTFFVGRNHHVVKCWGYTSPPLTSEPLALAHLFVFIIVPPSLAYLGSHAAEACCKPYISIPLAGSSKDCLFDRQRYPETLAVVGCLPPRQTCLKQARNI